MLSPGRWGRFFRTETIDEAGTNCLFGSPYSPNEGVLVIPCPDPNGPLILRVMDEDWGTKDDVCGEMVIRSAKEIVAKCAGQPRTFELRFKGQLRKKGEAMSKAGSYGTVCLTASWQVAPGQGPPLLRIQVHTALGLRNADAIMGIGYGNQNDVYIQVYSPSDGKMPNEEEALPSPNKSATLPAGEYTFELPALKLPDKLPGTYEEYEGTKSRLWDSHSYKTAHVRYFVEASIDIAWSMDPFVRVPFSVSARLPSSLIAGACACFWDALWQATGESFLVVFERGWRLFERRLRRSDHDGAVFHQDLRLLWLLLLRDLQPHLLPQCGACGLDLTTSGSSHTFCCPLPVVPRFFLPDAVRSRHFRSVRPDGHAEHERDRQPQRRGPR